ncbi:hypothetical protein AB0M68_03700 [Streptomyces sp. NPDC051453]|uniref:hypothetical protein n=1 Tax=Streptomyces sp. NPDC051453 TaxID=3154941 RepID=UPI00343B1C5F
MGLFTPRHPKSDTPGANASYSANTTRRSYDSPAPQTPDNEQRINAEYERRRAAAADHYRKTGDSSRMWAEKAAQNDAIDAERRRDTPQGRREERRAKRKGWF